MLVVLQATMNVPKWAVSLTVVLIASYGLLCTAQKVCDDYVKFANKLKLAKQTFD